MRRLHQRDIDDLFAMAQRGGLGHAIAITDCIAEGPDHLMYMEGDTLVLLADSGEDLLAYCEGEVGWVKRANVKVARPCASSSSASSTTPTAIVPPSDARSGNSTPSISAASVQTPHTPGSTSSVYSARSSHSTTKDWPTTPYTLNDVPSVITDGHEPVISSGSPVTYLGHSAPSPELHVAREQGKLADKRRQADDAPADADETYSGMRTGRIPYPTVTDPNSESTKRSAPSIQYTEHTSPSEAAPPQPSSHAPSGLFPAPSADSSRIRRDQARPRSSSPLSAYSDDSDTENGPSTDGLLGSDLPYTRAEPERLSPTPTYAATVSLSALGVHHPPSSLSALPIQSIEHPIGELPTRRVREARKHLVRHVEHRAGNLAVPMEPAYRQSFAAETARFSEVPTEVASVYTLAELSVYDSITSPTAEEFAFSDTEDNAALPSPHLSPFVNDSDYPRTPGTFGAGRTPEEFGSPAQFTKMNLPSPDMGGFKVPRMAPIASVRSFPSRNPERVQVVEMDQMPPPRPARHPASLAGSVGSNRDVDDRSHTHSASEETVLLDTPQSAQVGAFGDESPNLNDRLEAIEVAHPDSSLTDPNPPSPEKQQQSLNSMLAPQWSNAPSRPDSPASYDSRWSMESRAAAKAVMRGGFYALGHSPQIAEPQHQTFHNWAANVANEKPPIPPLPSSPLIDSVSTSPAQPDVAQLPSNASPPTASGLGIIHSTLDQGDNGTLESSNAETGSAPVTLPFRVTPTPATSSSTSHSAAPSTKSVEASPNMTHQQTSTPPPPVIPPRRRPVGFVGPQNGDAKENPAGPVPATFLFHNDPGADVPDGIPSRTLVTLPSAAAAAPPPRPQPRLAVPLVPAPSLVQARATVGRSASNQHARGPGNAVRPQQNLVRRVTSPNPSSLNNERGHQQQSQHRPTLPSEMFMSQQQPRQQKRRDMTVPPMLGSSDDHSSQNHGSSLNHSSVSHQLGEFSWNAPPLRTAFSSDDNHHHARLVSLPSELLDTKRPSPSRSVSAETPSKPANSPNQFGSLSSRPPLDRIPSLTSLPRPSISSPASTNVATPPPKGSFSSSDHGDPAPSPPTLTRGRSRSFSAAIAKSLGVGRKNSQTASPNESTVPPLPNSYKGAKEELVGGPMITFKQPPKPGFLRTRSSASSMSDHKASFDSTMSGRPAFLSNDSTTSISRPWLSHTRGASSTSKMNFRPAVSHRDYADPTVNADGMEFEIIQPRKVYADTPMVRTSVDSSDLGILSPAELKELEPTSSNGAESPPELDEWGFLKDIAPTPEIFRSRHSPAEVRAAEQKWLSIISTPLAHNQTAPKKVRRMVIEQGVPSSLRGRVWEWFMSNGMNGRVGGLFQRLLSDEPGPFDDQINRDVEAVYADHSVFYRKGSPGQTDLRTLLRAYVIFAPSGYRTDIARLAGALLIHAVLEDAFWLLAGLFNGVLKSYYVLDTKAFIIDLNVFGGILEGSEPRIGQLFRSAGVLPEHYLVKWWSGMFIRSLPWPTVLRLLDVVISEGPRYLMIASLAILTLSRDRLLALPRTQKAIVDYLQHLPQDSLLLPETFMKACDQVKLRDEDLKKLRASVKAQLVSRS